MAGEPVPNLCVLRIVVRVRPEFAETARALGRLLAGQALTLVYGSAEVGLMGLVADAAPAAGGQVVGVTPRHLFGREIAHRHPGRQVAGPGRDLSRAGPGGTAPESSQLAHHPWAAADTGCHSRQVASRDS